MKHRVHLGFILGLLLLLAIPPATRAQSFSVPWFVLAAGGGTTTSSNLSLTGTFGQWEATPQPISGGIFSLTGGFWSFLGTNAVSPLNTLFNDDFSGNTIDPAKWSASGHSVVQSNGTMEVLTTVTDDGGVLASTPFAIESNGLITMTRQVFLHPQPSSLTNYPGTYFMGQFGINVTGVPQFSIYYADFDYGDGVTYMARHGFFLARDEASPLYIVDQSNVSAAIAPLFDTWFSETVTYDPVSGIVEYFINNVSQMTFNVGALPATVSPTMSLTFNAWGWWTGHEQLFQDLFVTQVPGVTNTGPTISLIGNLALGDYYVPSFGGGGGFSLVTSPPPLQGGFVISNGGPGTLTISYIDGPTNFGSSLNTNTLAPDATTTVQVGFSWGIVGDYQGVFTVVSDATSGVNTIPVSAFTTTDGLTLAVNGKGTVSPNLSNKPVITGKTYTFRALPASGYVFSNWSDSANSSSNPLVFTMPQSARLVANFVPAGPFVLTAGTYNGLFSSSNGVTEETAGMSKNLVVGQKGTYSGTLFIGGAGHGFSGKFNSTGQSTNHITRSAKQGGSLTVLMILNLSNTPPQITGTVSGTNNGVPWTANLVANRATNSGTAEFTMVGAPTLIGLPSVPQGYSYVLLAQHAGVLSFSGAMADGTALSQSVPEDETGGVPVYASLYGNTGLVTGWISISNNILDGTLDWIKKSAHSGFYTNGFTNVLIAQGASWINHSPVPAITLTNGQLNLLGGSLAKSLSFTVGVSAKNTVTNGASTPTNSLSGTINPKTGLLTVTFGNGIGRATTVGRGAVLQDTTNAAGFFLGKTNAGSLILDQ